MFCLHRSILWAFLAFLATSEKFQIIGISNQAQRELTHCTWSNWKGKMVCPSSSHSAKYSSSSLKPLNMSEVAAFSKPPKGTSHNTSSVIPIHVAVLYHGHYDRVFEGQCSDFFTVAHNHALKVFNPLRSQGIVLSTFFHTYRNIKCRHKDDFLVEYLRPVSYEFSESNLPRIIDSYVRVLQLAYAASPRPEVMLICRFDIMFTWSILDLNIEWHKVNLSWRDVRDAWHHFQKSNDLFITLPIQYTSAMEKSLYESAKRSPSGDGNFVFKSLASSIGPNELRFIDSEFRTSTVDSHWLAAHKNDTGGAKVFLAIERSCEGMKMDAESRKLMGNTMCWRGADGLLNKTAFGQKFPLR